MVGHFNVLHRVIMPVAIGKRGILTKEVRRGFEAPYRCKKNREAQLSTARQIPIFKSDNLYHMLLKTGHALRGWQVATQIIWGLRDPSFTKKIARDLERLLPNHHPTVYLPKAGHFLTEEQPELVLAAIKKFLANTS